MIANIVFYRLGNLCSTKALCPNKRHNLLLVKYRKDNVPIRFCFGRERQALSNRLTLDTIYKDNSNFTTLREHSGIKAQIDAHQKVTRNYEGTVENFAATIIIHGVV